MSLTLTITVIPNSSHQKCIIDKAGRLKCYIHSAPEKNKANYELIDLLADKLTLSKRLITIIKGQTQRTKVLHIDSQISYHQCLMLLGIEQQLNIESS